MHEGSQSLAAARELKERCERALPHNQLGNVVGRAIVAAKTVAVSLQGDDGGLLNTLLTLAVATLTLVVTSLAIRCCLLLRVRACVKRRVALKQECPV